jgi:hypothetical protein
MFRGNAHNTRTPDTYSDAQVTEYIKELSKSLDETREELAKLRAAQQQSSSSSSSSQTPPSAK